MKSIKIIKLLSAVLLLVAMFLPLSRCSRSEPAPKKEIVYEYTYSWSHFDYRDPSSTLPVIAFLWPLPIVLYDIFGKKQWLKTFLSWLEPLLAVGSGYLLYLRTMFGELLFGGYVAYIALSAYFLVSIIALFGRVYNYFKLKRGK